MNFIFGTDEADTLIGTAGDDIIFGGPGDDFIDGGGGFNWAGYWTSPGPIVAFLFANEVANDGFGGRDTLNNINGIAGTAFDDVIWGNNFGNILQGFNGNDTIFGLGGDDIIRAGEGDDWVDGGDGTDTMFFVGNRADYTVTAIPGGFLIVDNVPDRYGRNEVYNVELFQFENTRLTAGELLDPNARGDGIPYPPSVASNTILGTDGNDVLRGTPENDLIDGGPGVDTLVSSVLRREAAVTGNPSDSAMMTGPEGSDTLISIETIRFVDGWLSFDPNTTVGSVVRLYEATLGRGPDPIGLGSWVAALDGGALSLLQAAQGFVGSMEFQLRYGNVENAGFVTLLYENVLGRAPDQEGFQAWTGALDANALSRAEVVVGFSESLEFTNATAARFESGIWAPDPVAVEVLRYYTTVLDRLPDAGGLTNWISARSNGLSREQMGEGFVGSAEFQLRYGDLQNQAFVEQLYINSLGRMGDAEGIANWTGALDAGALSRADVVAGFAFSDEMTARLTPFASDGIFLA